MEVWVEVDRRDRVGSSARSAGKSRDWPSHVCFVNLNPVPGWVFGCRHLLGGNDALAFRGGNTYSFASPIRTRCAVSRNETVSAQRQDDRLGPVATSKGRPPSPIDPVAGHTLIAAVAPFRVANLPTPTGLFRPCESSRREFEFKHTANERNVRRAAERRQAGGSPRLTRANVDCRRPGRCRSAILRRHRPVGTRRRMRLDRRFSHLAGVMQHAPNCKRHRKIAERPIASRS